MKTRIAKTLFYKSGGFANPKNFRKMIGGCWSYWRLENEPR